MAKEMTDKIVETVERTLSIGTDILGNNVLPDTVTISSQEYEALKADKVRMDFLSDEKSVYWIQISRQPEGKNIFNSNRVSKLRDIIDEFHNGLLIK